MALNWGGFLQGIGRTGMNYFQWLAQQEEAQREAEQQRKILEMQRTALLNKGGMTREKWLEGTRGMPIAQQKAALKISTTFPSQSDLVEAERKRAEKARQSKEAEHKDMQSISKSVADMLANEAEYDAPTGSREQVRNWYKKRFREIVPKIQGELEREMVDYGYGYDKEKAKKMQRLVESHLKGKFSNRSDPYLTLAEAIRASQEKTREEIRLMDAKNRIRTSGGNFEAALTDAGNFTRYYNTETGELKPDAPTELPDFLGDKSKWLSLFEGNQSYKGKKSVTKDLFKSLGDIVSARQKYLSLVGKGKIQATKEDLPELVSAIEAITPYVKEKIKDDVILSTQMDSFIAQRKSPRTPTPQLPTPLRRVIEREILRAANVPISRWSKEIKDIVFDTLWENW